MTKDGGAARGCICLVSRAVGVDFSVANDSAEGRGVKGCIFAISGAAGVDFSGARNGVADDGERFWVRVGSGVTVRFIAGDGVSVFVCMGSGSVVVGISGANNIVGGAEGIGMVLALFSSGISAAGVAPERLSFCVVLFASSPVLSLTAVESLARPSLSLPTPPSRPRLVSLRAASWA